MRYYAFLLLMAMYFVSCTDDAPLSSLTDEEVVVSFRPGLDSDLQTRAIAKGERINQLVVVAYKDRKEVCRVTREWNPNSSTDISLRLLKDHSYEILFWAQHTDVYTIAPDGTVSTDYSKHADKGFAGMEELDAFCALQKIEVGSTNGVATVLLKHSLAQLNFADAATRPAAGSHKAVVTFYSIPTSYNFLTGEVTTTDVTNDVDDVAFTFTDFPEEEILKVDDTAYYYIASNYLFAPANGTVYISATLDLQDAEGASIKIFEFKGDKAIPLRQNKKTNLLGTIF